VTQWYCCYSSNTGGIVGAIQGLSFVLEGAVEIMGSNGCTLHFLKNG